MDILILTEGGNKIGFGHITRCLSLYQAFAEKTVTVQMIVNCDELSQYLLENANYIVCDWLSEQEKIFDIAKQVKMVIVDSYLADVEFYNKLSQFAKKTVCIDDNKRIDYPSGVVMNGLIYAHELDYPKREGLNYLLGPRYAFLRKAFWDIPEKKIKQEPKSIMITFGGQDESNMTGKVLEFINRKYPNFTKNVIIGKCFKNISRIEELKGIKVNLIYYPDVKQMKKVMFVSDIAISAGGQTLYELARVGVPTVAICLADDQLLNLEGWQKKGFIDYIGWYDNENLNSELEKSIERLISYRERSKRSNIARSLIDGKGPRRIIESLNY